jgi:hypothetical protein
VPKGHLQKTQDVVLVFREEKCGLKYVIHSLRVRRERQRGGAEARRVV